MFTAECIIVSAIKAGEATGSLFVSWTSKCEMKIFNGISEMELAPLQTIKNMMKEWASNRKGVIALPKGVALLRTAVHQANSRFSTKE